MSFDKNISSFENLFKLYYPKVKRFALSFLNDSSDAEEVAQDVFIKLWKNRHKLMNIIDMDKYILTISKNTLLDHLRKQKSHETMIKSLSSLCTDQTEADVHYKLEAAETNASLMRIVDQMPEQRRKVFTLSRFEGLSNQDIASEMGLSKRTVEKHLQIAMKQLHQKFPLS